MRSTVLAAAAMAFVLVLAACGGEPDAGTTQETDGPAATPTVERTPVTDDTATEAAGAREGDGELHIGYLLPETGPIAFLGPPQIAGVEYAIGQINEAGGVLGSQVELSGGDEAGDEQVASRTVDRLMSDGVDAIIGAAASAISLSVIDKITGSQIVQCSGSNTGATFTDYDDDGFYFRTVPSNVLQGGVLAEQVVADGHIRTAVAARADDYGRSLSNSVVEALSESGAEVVVESSYDPNLQDFSPVAVELTEEDPDAIVLISFEEGAQLLRELVESGYGPNSTGLYGTDGMPLPELAELVSRDDPSVLEGFTATGASSGYDDEFIAELQEFSADLETTLFAPYTFDCAVVIALAAEAAGSVDPSVFVDEMIPVTRDGQECGSFEDCKTLLEGGEDIDYSGASGPLDFVEAGEPSVGLYDILQLDAQGDVQTVDTVLSREVGGGE